MNFKLTAGGGRKAVQPPPQPPPPALDADADDVATSDAYADFLATLGAVPPPPHAPAVPVGRGAVPVAPARAAAVTAAFALEEDDEEEEGGEGQPPSPPPPPSTKPPRAIDALKAEFEAAAGRRRAGGRAASPPPSHDDHHPPLSTNLILAGLPPAIDEATLASECGARFGPVASVKIMWPRPDVPGDAATADAAAGLGHVGYVAFMSRAAAEAALAALDGATLWSSPAGTTTPTTPPLRVAWDRAVPLPALPLVLPDRPGGGALGNNDLVRAASDLRAPPSARAAAARAALPLPPPAVGLTTAGEPPPIPISHPADPRAAYIIDTLASYVVAEGPSFELAVMVRVAQAAAAASARGGGGGGGGAEEEEEEGGPSPIPPGLDPDWAFLFDRASPDHAYYRWRLASLAWGDGLGGWWPGGGGRGWALVEGGPRFIPPPPLVPGGGGGGCGGGGGGGPRAGKRGRGGRGSGLPLTAAQRRADGGLGGRHASPSDASSSSSSDDDDDDDARAPGGRAFAHALASVSASRPEEAPLPAPAAAAWRRLLARATLARAPVRRAMAFAIDHGGAHACAVAETLAAALLGGGAATPDPAAHRAALLMVVADILANAACGREVRGVVGVRRQKGGAGGSAADPSPAVAAASAAASTATVAAALSAARGAAAYATLLPPLLPPALARLAADARAAGGRLAQEGLRRVGTRALRAWRGGVGGLPPRFVDGLEAGWEGGLLQLQHPPGEGGSGSGEEAADLAPLRTPALRALCAARGLEDGGRRDECMSRLERLRGWVAARGEGAVVLSAPPGADGRRRRKRGRGEAGVVVEAAIEEEAGWAGGGAPVGEWTTEGV